MSESSAVQAASRPRVYVSMAILFFVVLIANIDRFAFSVVLDPLKHSFNLSDTQAGLLAGTAFAFFYATLAIPIARIADIGNRRNLISVSIGLWSLATILCGYAQSFIQIFIFRMMVGVGEAGAVPPTHSLIANYFPAHRRSFPYAFIYVGATLGTTIAYIGGAWLTRHYGWQMMLIMLGLPGILVAGLARIFVVENRPRAPFPPVGKILSDSMQSFGRLLSNPAYRLLLISYGLFGLVSFGTSPWDIPFFTRTFSVTIEKAATTFGLVGLTSGITGLLLGGLIGNLLAKKSLRWLAYFPALCLLTSFPFYVGKYLLPDFVGSMASMGIANLLLIAFVGPFFAAIQANVGDKERGTAVAFAVFLANMIGLGLAPPVIGFLSEQLAASHGVYSLRYAIPVVLLALPLAAFFSWRAGRRFKV